MAVDISTTHTAFPLEVYGYGAFSPGVVFLKPEPSVHLINLHDHWRSALKEIIPDVINKFPERDFHPHITLAHRDVEKDQFKSIWDYYRNRSLNMTATIGQFCILTNTHVGWEPQKFYPLQQIQ
jgi:2'-5' RNA ligase